MQFKQQNRIDSLLEEEIVFKIILKRVINLFAIENSVDFVSGKTMMMG